MTFCSSTGPLSRALAAKFAAGYTPPKKHVDPIIVDVRHRSYGSSPTARMVVPETVDMEIVSDMPAKRRKPAKKALRWSVESRETRDTLQIIKIDADEVERYIGLLAEFPDWTQSQRIFAKSGYTISEVIEAASIESQYLESAIRSLSREKGIVAVRQAACFVAYHMTGRSYKVIGREFCRDHTTMVHAYQRVSETIGADAEVREFVARVVKRVVETKEAARNA